MKKHEKRCKVLGNIRASYSYNTNKTPASERDELTGRCFAVSVTFRQFPSTSCNIGLHERQMKTVLTNDDK